MSGCGSNQSGTSGQDNSSESSSAASQTASTESSAEVQEYDLKELGLVADFYDDKEHEAGYQLESPDVGEEIAIMHTNMGDVSMKFFPEAAPKTVENFVTHAQNGYYDGLTFHRVINDFMIQGGDPSGNGTGGESVSGGKFEDEFSNKLFNIRGSVAMANSGADTNGSQFFINQSKDANFEMNELNWKQTYQAICQAQSQGQLDAFLMMNGSSYIRFYNTDIVPDDVKKLYEKVGGNPTLDGAFNALDRGHTVFAQVFSGMDVVDKIAAVETDPLTNKPVNDVIIDSIEITAFK
ncbi:MAG: peptidylprolyl isomerase [Clostridia bacterium]|nr:peptidylprolyl isomerase [Clostridia bacterium]